jgi:ectoine hydroxylase-related dioxygenase (phytanoyl-CoA dioxygenase family)
VKPARDGGVVAWHQDYSYWTRTRPVAHLTCWIGLDDSTRENGCVHYVPGSHRWDLLPRGDLASNMESVFDVLREEQKRQSAPVAIELKKGEASFHHPMMLHGSYENTSDSARRACVINVFRDGVISDSDEPLLAGIPPIPRGEKIEGRFFPLLTG